MYNIYNRYKYAGSYRNNGESITVLMATDFTKKSAVFGQIYIRDVPVCHDHPVAIIEAVLSDSDWLLEADH